MTKVKIMLSGIVTIAAISGASGLKSKKSGATALYTICQFEPFSQIQSCDKFLTEGTIDPLSVPSRAYYYITTTPPTVAPDDDCGYKGADCAYHYYTIIL